MVNIPLEVDTPITLMIHSYILSYTEIAEGNRELAVERHESLTQLSLSCLATMVNIPIEVDTTITLMIHYTEIAEGNQELAVVESLLQLSLATMVNIPLEVDTPVTLMIHSYILSIQR